MHSDEPRKFGDGTRPDGILHRLSVYALAVFATFGVWWLVRALLDMPRIPHESTGFLLMTIALGAPAALTWGVFLRSATRPLFDGPRARRHALTASGTGMLVMLLLLAHDAWMTRLAGQEAEVLASMDAASETTTLRDPERLTGRMEAFYVAMGSRDIEAMRAIGQFPLERLRPSAGEYADATGLRQRWKSRPATNFEVRLEDVCSCRTWSWSGGEQSQRCLLLLSVTVDDADGGPGPAKFLETWEHVGAEWYERCPGPVMEDCPADPLAEGYCRAHHPLRGW